LSYFEVKVETLLLLFLTENVMKQGCYGETGKKFHLPAFWDVTLFVRLEFPTFRTNIMVFPSGLSSPKRVAMLDQMALVYIFYRFERLFFLHSLTLKMEILLSFKMS
jgi:hypothetical protein